MKNRLSFIGIGLLVSAFPGEIANQIMVRNSVKGFVITMLNYVWFIALAYYVASVIDRKIQRHSRAVLVYLILYGSIGLLIEWFINGVFTLQWWNPAQLMMFSFWAAMVVVPYLFVREESTLEVLGLRRRITKYIAGWSVVAFLPALIALLFFPGALGDARKYSLLAFGIGSLGLYYYFRNYYKLLKAKEQGKRS